MWQLVLLVITTALAYVLRPKPAEQKPPALEDVEAPTADADRPISVVFGTRTISGPNVVWFGHLDTDAVRADEI